MRQSQTFKWLQISWLSDPNELQFVWQTQVIKIVQDISKYLGVIPRVDFISTIASWVSRFQAWLAYVTQLVYYVYYV